VPQVIETVVQGYASCYDPRCPGYEQEEVPVIRREAQHMREEYGGDIPGVDHSTIQAVEGDDPQTGEPLTPPCQYCGGPRIPSLEKRPEYARISGQDPLALLDLDQQKQVHEVQTTGLQQQVELERMRADMAEMKAELQRRKGGRPPKDTEE
jgi:hypothetical protein